MVYFSVTVIWIICRIVYQYGFLICLFVASIIYWFIVKLPLRLSWIIALCGIIINYLLLSYCKDHTIFPWKFPAFLLVIAFIYFGYLLKLFIKNYKKFISKSLPVLICLLLIIVLSRVFVAFTNNKVGMNENEYGNYLVFLFTSVAISSSLILLISKVEYLENKFVLWLGRNTLCFIGFNYVCRDITTDIYCYIPILKNYTIHWSVSFLMTLLLCILIATIVERARLLICKPKGCKDNNDS